VSERELGAAVARLTAYIDTGFATITAYAETADLTLVLAALAELQDDYADERRYANEAASRETALRERVAELAGAFDCERAGLKERIAELERERDLQREQAIGWKERASLSLDARDAAEAQLAAAREASDVLAKAALGLLTACETADAREDLPGDVDGTLMEAVRRALARCPDCNGFGTVDRRPHEDETIEPENQCPTCDGWGVLPSAALAEPTQPDEFPLPPLRTTVHRFVPAEKHAALTAQLAAAREQIAEAAKVMKLLVPLAEITAEDQAWARRVLAALDGLGPTEGSRDA
jgi:hypothetical protein